MGKSGLLWYCTHKHFWGTILKILDKKLFIFSTVTSKISTIDKILSSLFLSGGGGGGGGGADLNHLEIVSSICLLCLYLIIFEKYICYNLYFYEIISYTGLVQIYMHWLSAQSVCIVLPLMQKRHPVLLGKF